MVLTTPDGAGPLRLTAALHFDSTQSRLPRGAAVHREHGDDGSAAPEQECCEPPLVSQPVGHRDQCDPCDRDRRLRPCDAACSHKSRQDQREHDEEPDEHKHDATILWDARSVSLAHGDGFVQQPPCETTGPFMRRSSADSASCGLTYLARSVPRHLARHTQRSEPSRCSPAYPSHSVPRLCRVTLGTADFDRCRCFPLRRSPQKKRTAG